MQVDIKMKYLYVLTSGCNDIYYEQTLVSVLSLKHHDPDAFVALLVDDKTAETLTHFRAHIKSQINELVVVNLPEEMPAVNRSRWLKTSMRHHVAGDFLYMDGDTVVNSALNDIDAVRCDVGAVMDMHSPVSASAADFSIGMAKKLQFSLDPYSVDDCQYNGGVIFARDTPQAHEFFRLWHELWLYSCKNGIVRDQPSLSEANFRSGRIICELPGEWNCNISYGANHLTHARVLHFCASGGARYQGHYAHPLMEKEFYQNIKRMNRVDEKSMQMILNARSFFHPFALTMGPVAAKFLLSDFCTLCLFAKANFPRLFFLVEKISHHILIIKRRLFRR